MEQDDIMDFKALRAKFQDEEILLRQPRVRPVLPEKPQAALPPKSLTHHLPAGARPSILTSINQGLDRRASVGAPKVVFKEDKNSGWMPLMPQSPKTASKSNAKTKAGKDKDSKSAKASKDKLDGEDKDTSKPKSGKDKKGLFKTKETPELVPTTAPSKGTLRKIVFPGFKKASKTGSMDLNPILDSPSPDMGGVPAPLVPLVGDVAPALPPATIPDYHSVSALMPPTFIPIAPPSTAASQAPSVADAPAPEAAAWQETVAPWQVDTAPALVVDTLPVSTIPRPATPTSVRPPTPSSPAPDLASSGRFTPLSGAERMSAGEEVEVHPNGGEPRAEVMGSASSSPQMQRLSSALERAAEKTTTGKRTNPADQRILQALEKARRKVASPHTPFLMTPAPEDFPTRGSQVDLPPMGYEGPRNPEAAHLNGFENSASEASDGLPELMVVPPPPPRSALPDPQVLGFPPQKPARPPYVNLTTFLPPPLEETPALPEPWDQGEASDGLPEFEDTHSPGSQTPAASEYAWGDGDYSIPNGHIPGIALPDTRTSASTGDEDYGASASESGTPGFAEAQDVFDTSALSAPDNPLDSMPQLENFGNVYEDVNVSTTKKKGKVEGLKKRKGPPKNPYDVTQPLTNEEKGKTIRLGNFRTEKKPPTEGPDEKELKKKEKQRLEKEKKELKEQKEREKREQKEKGKKESDMKKRFNITGQEEAMYQAMATVTTKGRKDDLPVTDGENISIIRTTKCPKGKWLARNNSNTYGYISVDHVKLDIQEMMQMGKKPSSTNPIRSSMVDGGATAAGSRQHSNHYPESTGSFTDDSDEWTGDEEDPLTPTDPAGPFPPQSHTRTHSMPDTGNKELGPVHQHSRSDLSTRDPPTQAGHEALNKLATFFHPPIPVVEKPTASTQEESSHAAVDEERVSSPETAPAEEVSGDISDMLILPPPDVFADTEPGTSM